MQRQIDVELNSLRALILAMGAEVEKAVEESTEGLITRDPKRLDCVPEIESKINAFHLEVDEKCLKIIASQSPLAADLRLILAVIKINSDLERMGDQATNITHNVRDYLAKPQLKQDALITQMSKLVRKMIGDALEAFIKNDIVLSEQVLLQDDSVDEAKHKTFRDLVALMKQDASCVDAAVDLMLISRNLERLGDHATNIGEDVIFASTGKDIRHGGFTPGSVTE